MCSISDLVKKYQHEFNNNKTNQFRNNELQINGKITRMFIFLLTLDVEKFHCFLRECGLINSNQRCYKCNHDMTIKAKSVADKFMWCCENISDGIKCGETISIRACSLFTRSHLSIEDTFMLTYEILSRTSAKEIIREYGFTWVSVGEWINIIKEILCSHLDEVLEPVGGEGVVVEINVCIYGSQSEDFTGQWVFGGIEQDSGKLFLVILEDSTFETLTLTLERWVQPGTTIISENWKAFERFGEEYYNHLRIHCRLNFLSTDEITPSFSNTWQQLEIYLSDCDRNSNFQHQLSEFLFYELIKIKINDDNLFCKFLEIVRSIIHCP